MSLHRLSDNPSMRTSMKSLFARTLLSLALAAQALPSHAHGGGGSELSALSMLPVAVSVAAPVAVLSGGALLTVAAVGAASEGTVWVLERASDGARASIHLGSHVAAGASVAVGTVVACTAVSTGWVLSAAGRAIAFIPNEIGKALLHNERITP